MKDSPIIAPISRLSDPRVLPSSVGVSKRVKQTHVDTSLEYIHSYILHNHWPMYSRLANILNELEWVLACVRHVLN